MPRSRASYADQVQRIGAFVGTEARERLVRKHDDILQQGEPADDAHILIEGVAYRYQLLSDGRRAITAFLLPGELCELRWQRPGPADYGIAAATHCTLAAFAPNCLSRVATIGSEFSVLLDRQARAEEAITRAWIVGLSRRNAAERLAHLFCELRERFAAIGMATENAFELRVGQLELADALGITTIHVHRALKALRDAKMIQLQGGIVTFLDRPALQEMTLFSSKYLLL